VSKASRNWAAALIAIMAAGIVTAGAQHLTAEDFERRWPEEIPGPAQPFPPAAAQPSPAAPAQQPPPDQRAVPPAGARPLAPGSAIAGTWSGTVTQVGSESKYTVLLTITANGAETDYPEVNCRGKLTRIGASRSYAFFVEVIALGRADKGGRCPDGTITVARAGDNLAWAWFGSVQGDVVVAFGTLTRKPAR